MIGFSILFLALFLTMALTPFSSWLCIRINAVDVPGGRKIHAGVIPRGGGLAMAVGAVVPLLFWVDQNQMVTAIFIGAGIVFCFGFVDDLKTLGYKAKLIAQATAALIVILYGGLQISDLGFLVPRSAVLPTVVSIPLTLGFIVGVTNAINLADGLDGLASGICLLIFSCIGLLAFTIDDMAITLMAIALVGAIFGFIRFNTYPATIFMGDGGSQFLGFMAACLALMLIQDSSPFSRLLPLIILGFPILDTLTVMTERLAAGQSPFQADNRHFHHRLLKLGLFQTEAVTVIYIIQASLVSIAFFLRFHSEVTLLAGYVVFSILVLFIFWVSETTGFKLKRFAWIDTSIKGRLKALKERGYLICIVYGATKVIFTALLITSCLMVNQVWPIFSAIFAGVMLVMLLCLFMNQYWLQDAIRIALYLLLPVIIYFNQGLSDLGLLDDIFHEIYHLLFGLLVLTAILTLKFTRRQSGFRVRPLDLLVLFFAIALPVIPNPWMESSQLGLITIKLIIMMFALEVLLGEARRDYREMAIISMVALGIFGIKGLF